MGTIEDTTEIECLPLSDILAKNAPQTKFFDFFSLDIEGAEMEALLSLDYSQIQFGVLLIEADAHNEGKNMAVETFLESKGYKHLYNKARSDWFVNKNFHLLYEHVIHA